MRKTLRFKAEELARFWFEVDGRMLLCSRVCLRVREKEGTTKERSRESNSKLVSSSIQGLSRSREIQTMCEIRSININMSILERIKM